MASRKRAPVRRNPNTGMPFFTAPSRGYREPPVTRGKDEHIPEHRPEILAKIKKEVAEKGSYLQKYSNGEFISSSIACGRTYEECLACEVLDGAGYTIHFDTVNGIYWRRGGCFD